MLTLVKSSSIQTLDTTPDPSKMGIKDYWDYMEAQVTMIARRELILINNTLQTLPEERKRLFEKAEIAFQNFLKTSHHPFVSDGLCDHDGELPVIELVERVVPSEELEEKTEDAYNVLLYYIDKTYPWITVEIDAEGKVTIIHDKEENKENTRLLRYLLDSWVTLASYELRDVYSILLGFASFN
jgi:hypothetical protein